MSLELYTIGHSTHAFEEFVALLKRHGIQALADVRRFPGSRKYPHFNRDHFASALPLASIEYRWFEALGGRRKNAGSPSRNLGLRNESFRNYADYMMTSEFQQTVNDMLDLARQKRTAFMCSEAVYWRCHRRLVSDYLLMQGAVVRHIMPTGEIREHLLTEGAELMEGELLYPSVQSEQGMLFDEEGDGILP